MVIGVDFDGLGIAGDGGVELLRLEVLVALVLVLGSAHGRYKGGGEEFGIGIKNIISDKKL